MDFENAPSKEKQPSAFENYPLSTNLITSIVTLLICAVGVYLLWQLGMIWGILFILYIIGLELFTFKHGCSCCYYYGKRCAFYRSKVAPLFFKKDDPQKFCQRKVTFWNLLPTVLASLIPVIVGVFLLIKSFSLLILILTLIPVINWFIVNPLIFGKLVCLHCKQGRICCPANDFFGKKSKLDKEQ